MYLVSIVIAAYNAERTLKMAVDSVLQQRYENVEVVVVDDGSVDSTAEICASYGDRIRFFRQKNRGSSAARNLGISKVTGEIVGFLDADDIYLPNKLDQLVDLFEEYPEAGAVTGAFIQKVQGGEKITPEPGRVFKDGAKHGLIDYFMCEYRGFWVVHTNTILVKKTVLEAVGFFNEGLRFGEDVDLWSRIAGRYPLAYLDEPVAIYDRTNEQSLCYSVSVLDHGLEYLYGRREEKMYISRGRLSSYRLFRDKILLARLMLSIYEKNRACVWGCLKKLNPLPRNIRILIALAALALPVCLWPKSLR